MTPEQQASLDIVNSSTPTASNNTPGILGLLPTAGSILGGIGGAFIPGLGETGLSEVGGSAAGGAAGKWLENAITGQSGGELGAAAEGGLGAGIGGILGKVAGKLGTGGLDLVASKTAPKIAEAAAPVAGAEQVAYDKPFVDALSNQATQTKLAKQGIHYQTVRDFMQNQMGASSDPNEWSKIANFIAGNPGTKEVPTEGAWLSKQVQNAAANQPDIAQPDLINQLHTIAQSHGSSIIEPAATDTMGKWLSNGLNKAQVGESVGGQATYSSEGLLNLIKDIGNRHATNPLTMNPLAQTTASKMTEHEALPEVQQFLKNLVNNRGGVDEAIAKDSTTAEQAQKIMNEAPTPQAGKYVIDTLNNGKTAAEVNAAAALPVQADKIAKEVIDYQKGVSPSIQQAKEVGAAQAAAEKEAAAKAGQPHPAEKMTGDIVGGLTGGVPAKIGMAAKLAGGFVPAMNRIAQGGSDLLGKLPIGKVGALAGGALGTLAGAGADVANAAGKGGVTGIPGAELTGQETGGGMQPGVQAGATLADSTAMTNPNILAQLDRMLAADPFLADSLTGPIQQLAGPVTAAQAAQQMIPAYQQTLASAGGGGGPIQGLLARLGGLVTGGAANQVAPQQQAIQQLLARAGVPGMQVPGLYANQTGIGAGMAPTSAVLSALGGQ